MPTLGQLLPALLVVTLTFVLGNSAPAQNGRPATATTVNNLPSYITDKRPVPVLIERLQALSGKHYVLDGNLEAIPEILVTSTGLNEADEIKLITATLLLNGVAIIPVDDHTMKVVTVGTNKNPRSEGMRVYTNMADLPADDEIVTYYMALDHINPQEAAGIFTQVAPVHTYGAYVPTPSSQGVILTENASVIRELIELKKSIDLDRPSHARPPPPGAPDPAGPRPPGPPHDHPILGLIGFIMGIGLVVLIIAAGNVLAHRWMNRGKPKVQNVI